MKKIGKWINENRPLFLVAVFVFSLLIGLAIDWLFGAHLYTRVFYPDLSSSAGARAWSAVIYTVIVIFGIPSAFLLWVWRDRNVRDQLVEKQNEVKNQGLQLEVLKKQVDVQGRQIELQSEQIENQRKDIFLKEFQEVRKVAAGLFEIDGDESAKVQLQIAAMHQLRGFLQEEYPSTFRRAAFELLLAGHTQASQTVDVRQDDKQNSYWALTEMFEKQTNAVSKERAKILRDEAALLFNLGFPLQGRRLDFLDLTKANFRAKSLSGTSFRGSDLRAVDFESSTNASSDFSGAYLREVNMTDMGGFSAKFVKVVAPQSCFRKAQLAWGEFKGATLTNANFSGSECKFAKFLNADLDGANLSGADFGRAQFHGANLANVTVEKTADFKNAVFDSETEFADDWASLTESAKADYRSRWRDRGMQHVDDLKSGNDELDDSPF